MKIAKDRGSVPHPRAIVSNSWFLKRLLLRSRPEVHRGGKRENEMRET